LSVAMRHTERMKHSIDGITIERSDDREAMRLNCIQCAISLLIVAVFSTGFNPPLGAGSHYRLLSYKYIAKKGMV
jgi:hypothetical protein